jgi:hypothetical protein
MILLLTLLALTSPAPSPCNLTPEQPLRSTQRYGIFGDDSFDTLVCGYLVTRPEEVWGEKQTTAYLRIVQFGDPKFQAALQRGIDSGNHLNAKRDGQYEMSLGCWQDNSIHTDGAAYLTPTLQAALKNSLNKTPIALKLSFNRHPGTDCTCCHLMDQIRPNP